MNQCFESALFKELINKSVWIFQIAQSHTESIGVLSHSIKHRHEILLGSTPEASKTVVVPKGVMAFPWIWHGIL